MEISNYNYLRQVCLSPKEQVLPWLDGVITPGICTNAFPVRSWVALLTLLAAALFVGVAKYFPVFAVRFLRSKTTVAISRFQANDFLSQFLNTPSWTSFFALALGSIAVFFAFDGAIIRLNLTE